MMPARRTQNWLPSIFNDFFGSEWADRANSTTPAVNIMETPQEYQVEVAAAGLTKDDFQININDENQLVITMEKKQEQNDQDEKGMYLRREFSYSSFTQSLLLPDDVNRDDISARMENGVLTIDIPKKSPEEKQKAERQIQIQGPDAQQGRRTGSGQSRMNVSHEGQRSEESRQGQQEHGEQPQQGQQSRHGQQSQHGQQQEQNRQQPEYAHEGQHGR